MPNAKVLSRANIQSLTITAIMVSITAIMSFTPLGTVPLPVISITWAFLPAIITAVAVGFWQGVFVALSAGIFSFIRSYFVITWLSPFLQNPLTSVLPRVMIAVVVFLVFKALSQTKLPKIVNVAIAAAAGSITNTVGVLGSIWVLYGAGINNAAIERGYTGVWAMYVSIITANASLELVGNTIIATAIIMTLYKAKVVKI
ncbi:MAG: ECF transporter S component [Defluviitaleaceae bacterium]|nr:ECF transporter S component [Defluviitaleaceae bacterium]